MTNIVNITDKFTKEDKGILQIGNKKYEIDKSVEAVMRFEELADDQRVKAVVAALEGALGEKASKEIGVRKMGAENLKVLLSGVTAAMQGISFEEVAARFQQQ
ncbi:hypothetical protein [Paenibacillus riograndensis]|uniref:Uncharacterized protein n=1 Tax=Paenibacillus riograndensis SBR5 TaxID=1073571 RepID=A0A0E3WFZ9_9BACL|nr:hypothetical protein [Paenibacillus riograndensis]CQR51483.1 hypothetical protein PRIO_0229 [Paenibacillus riograndensis SBR5]